MLALIRFSQPKSLSPQSVIKMRGLASGWWPTAFQMLQPLPGCHLKDRLQDLIQGTQVLSLLVWFSIMSADMQQSSRGQAKSRKCLQLDFGNMTNFRDDSKNSPSEMRSRSGLGLIRSMRIFGLEGSSEASRQACGLPG